MELSSAKKVLLTIHEPLSARIFFDCGIVSLLAKRLNNRLEILSTFRFSGIDDWRARFPGICIRTMDEVYAASGATMGQKLRMGFDDWLDRKIGFFPLAIRLNLRNNFHLERMSEGHKNDYLNLSCKGPLPEWDTAYDWMLTWIYGNTRYLAPQLQQYLATVSAVVSGHLQHPSTVPFIIGSRRLGLPLVGYIASWDHLVGKGVVASFGAKYIVQNDIMRRDLIRYHKVEEGRIAVTGWPQTDVYCARRPREKYLELVASFGMDPRKACILITGNSHTNAPFEPAFFKRLVQWWESGGGKDRYNMVFRPHPKDNLWKERFDVANIQGRPGIFVQSPTYMDLEVLSLLLQHVECVITNAGTILLDSLVNDRPTISVLYDEGEPAGSCFAYKNVVGEHYKELMASEAFYRAGNFEEVVRGIEACVARPAERSAERKKVSRQIMGELDGKAAERVVDAIMAGLGGC